MFYTTVYCLGGPESRQTNVYLTFKQSVLWNLIKDHSVHVQFKWEGQAVLHELLSLLKEAMLCNTCTSDFRFLQVPELIL